MKLFRMIGLAAAALMFTTSAYALECSDLDFSGEVSNNFPNVGDYCQEVIEAENGERFARIHARVKTPGFSSIVLQYQYPDGTWGETRKATPPSDFRARLSGRETRIRDLVRGQEINIYLKEGQWELAMTDRAEVVEIAAVAPYVAPVVIEEEEPEPEPEPEMPKTATMVPFVGLLGGLLMAFGLALRLRRK